MNKLRKILGLTLLGVLMAASLPTVFAAPQQGHKKGGKKGGSKGSKGSQKKGGGRGGK